ncbi:MAG: pilus assembly protein PilM, partial [Candidatus Omnitrophica bacterium]|nr:pilus assembly protein PilM [Candidatus Omnitrophota bacterium]
NSAEEIKKTFPEKISKPLDEFLIKLASEVRNSFDYYETQLGGSSVKKIYISGGTSKIRGIKEKLVDILGIAVSDWDPFRKISFSQSLDFQNVKPYLAELPVAVGLALRR